MKRLHHTALIPCIAAASLLLLQGCAATGSPEWDARFGDSLRQVRAQQLIDPAAPRRHADTSSKIDGRSAREVRDNYVDSYASPPTSNVTTGGTGTGK